MLLLLPLLPPLLLAQVPSFKFVPLVYQIASRMSEQRDPAGFQVGGRLGGWLVVGCFVGWYAVWGILFVCLLVVWLVV